MTCMSSRENQIIRVLVVVDSPTVSTLITAILQESGGFDVVGVARNGQEA